jgi:hypothetical protein
MEYKLRMGRVKNIKMRVSGGCSECGVREWFAVVISFSLDIEFLLEMGDGGGGSLVGAVDLGDVISVELVLALAVPQFNYCLAHCACFWRN